MPVQEDAVDGKRECELCGGTLFPNARKCGFCGNIVAESSVSQTQAAGSGRTAANVNTNSALLLGLPTMGAIASLFVIGRMSLLQNPFPKLLLIYAVVAFITAVVVFVEAKAHQVTLQVNVAGKEVAVSSSIGWFLLVLVLWPIGFPLYFRGRATKLTPDFTKPSLVVALIFTLVFAGLAVKMQKQASSVREANRKLANQPTEQEMRAPPIDGVAAPTPANR